MLGYRILITLFAPGVAVLLLWQVLWRGEGRGGLAQRLGGGGGGGSGRPGAIWVHGASNGELASARALIAALAAAFPDRSLVVTANTATGRDLVRGWGIAGLTARLAPVDYRWALARFRARWRPAAVIVLENELWPNRIVTARAPVLCVAARMSARSARRWARLGGLARAVLQRVDWLSAQDPASATRFTALGLDAARLGPVLSLKPGVTLPPPPAAELDRLRQVFDRAETVLAASTHAGEEAILIAAFATARAANPALKLILAPRHPRRGPEIAARIARAGLPLAIRSAGQPPGAATAVYLADTLGEMPLWYALAGVTFVGGSLVDRGGHTPFEPAQAGSAVLHGPHVTNFEAAYAALDAAGGAMAAATAPDIAAALAGLRDDARRSRQAATAAEVLAKAGGDGAVEAIVAAVATAMSRQA